MVPRVIILKEARKTTGNPNSYWEYVGGETLLAKYQMQFEEASGVKTFSNNKKQE